MGLGSLGIYKLKIFSKPFMALLPILAPPLCSSSLRESVFLAFLDGSEHGLFIATAYLWQGPMQGKCRKYHHGQLMGKPDQCRTLLPSIYKSWTKLSLMTESFKSLRRKPNICFQVSRMVSCAIFHTFLAPFLFSFSIWKGSHLSLKGQNLSKEPVSQLNDLSTCQT